MKNEIILFEDEDVKLEVNLKDDTVWLNRSQIAELFERDIKTIGKHINNALKEELDNSVVANFATTAKDGKTYQVDYYNLDMIISVGYRVKSKRGIAFRRWANKVLKDYLLKGYAINNKRLEYLEKTIKLIEIANRADERLESDVFALERNQGLKSIINTLYQTYDGKEVYYSLEEKAANFLYLIVKDHVFIDGNKRIAATLFIYFLQFYDILYKNNKKIIDNNTLAALTILIAESEPNEKNILINLITNFLT